MSATTPTDRRPSTIPYRPELDGLRALSVLAVIVYHVPRAHGLVPAGFIGVDLFFALSGALITQLLLREHDDTGRVALGRFYARRLRRLYPALLAMLAFVIVASFVAYSRASFVSILRDAAISGLYLASFVAPFRAMPLLGHMWSLSIEELFYLVWPLSLAIVAKSGRRAIVGLLVLVVIGAFGWRVHLWFDAMASAHRIYFAPDTRADALAWGCLAGFAVHSGWAARARRALLVLGPCAGLGIAILMHEADRSATWFATWGYSLTSILAATVVARLFVAPSAALATKPLVVVGRLSYSLYLWHIPLIAMGSDLGVPAEASLAVAVVLAVLSYRFVESRWRAR
ncbi:MAG TPA: acyltransferase [Polyangiaceae bacterium]|nr:acyltransferase [Polyangiaceae bacterium]